MGKLTNEFVEECLDRQDGDVPQLILAIAEGANPIDALLERISREEILDWLQQEFDGLLMHGFGPLLKNDGLERNNAEVLLGYLEKSKAEMSPGLNFEVEPVGDPGELGAEGKHYQEFDVTIRCEGVELGSCVLESEGEYVSDKWVGEPAQWPTLLRGLIPLPTVMIEQPQRESREVRRVGDDPSDERSTGGVRLAQGELFDVIKEYDQVVDRPEARKQLEQTNPALVAAGDKAVTELRGEKVEALRQNGAHADKRYESSRLTMRVTKYRAVCDCTLPRLEKWAERWMRDSHFRHAVRGLLYGDTWSKQEMEWLMSFWHKRHSLSQPIKEYDRIVDGPEGRKRLEKEQPGLVAARDQAVVQQKRERIQQELAARSARQNNSRHR